MAIKRNGEIDLFRFIFAVVVLLFHFDPYLKWSIFKWGSIGVEFFFLVSGYLLARRGDQMHAYAGGMDDHQISTEYWQYILRKFRSFFRYYVFAIILQIIVRYIFINRKLWMDYPFYSQRNPDSNAVVYGA